MSGSQGAPRRSRTTADVSGLSGRGDHLGAYLGLELDLGTRVSTGPELGLSLLTREGGDVDLHVLPRLSWHVIWKL